jgi:predicted dehydrogenase
MLQPHQSGITVQTKDNWRIDPSISGGGLFHDLAPHQLDLLYYFFGKPLTVKGVSANKGGYYEADDTVNGEIILKGDIIFQGHWCFAAAEGERTDECEIIGERGKIVFSFFSHSTILLSTSEGEQEISFDKLPHVQQPMIEKVVLHFLGEGSNPCSGEEGVEVMRMIDGLTSGDRL